MKYIIKCVFLLFWLIFLIAFILSITAGYKHSLDFFISLLHQQQNAGKIAILVTAAKFKLMQQFMVTALLVLSGVFYYFNDFYTSIAFYIRDLSKALYRCLQTCWLSEGKYVLILPFIASVFFAVVMPVSYDEAWTYLNFTSQGPVTSMCYYPAPNNHILHSLITSIMSYIPLGSLLCMRIPSIVINLLTWCIAYAFIKRQFNKKTALIIVSISSMLFISVYYSYMSRGYALVNLFFITSFYAAFHILRNNNNNRSWVAFSVSAVLGLYTMPSFLYPLMILNAFILFSDHQHLKKLFQVNLGIFIVSSILYLPVMLVNGAGMLVQNQYVAPIPRIEVLQRLPSFFSSAISEITGINWLFTLLLIATVLVVMLIRKQKQLLIGCSIFIFAPFLLLVLHSVIPFSRTFVYYNFLLVFVIMIPFHNQFERIKISSALPFLILIQSLLLFNFYSKIDAYEAYSITSHKVIQQIEGDKKFVCNDGLFDALLLFELKTKEWKGWGFQYYNSVEMSADTLQNADFSIINKKVDKTIRTSPKIATPYYNVY